MHSKELIERVEELAKVYSKVIVLLDSKERKIEMFESYYKILRTLQDIQSSETLERSFYDWKLFNVSWLKKISAFFFV